MNIHLIRSREVDEDLLTGVVSLLQSIPGAIHFHSQVEIPQSKSTILESRSLDFMKWNRRKKIPLDVSTAGFKPPKNSVHWNDIFSKCRHYRDAMRIRDEEMIILLTAETNHRNWFSCLDPHMLSSGFIHTADWELYLDAPPVFPIAYEVIALVLQRDLLSNGKEMKHFVHSEPRGCINDFCREKRDIMLKLRTADICRDCIEELQKQYPSNIIDHSLSIIESLRTKMLFAQNFRQNRPVSHMRIDRNMRILLTDYDNIEICLRPLERALYMLFLRHPEGIMMSGLCDHRQELFELYAALCEIGDRAEIKQRIDEMTNMLSNSASEKMSRIKKTFEGSVGSTLARHYYIKGERGEEKYIALDRSFVIFE